MKKISINILIFIVINVNLFCQSVVISEYYNSNIIRNEWTELLVIEDNLNLTGYTLRDNSSSSGVPDKWQGGVRFRNHQLWKNLRAGSIIVINHRKNTSFNTDIDKSDGYIEVDAENTELFEKRCFDCDTATDWVFKALSIAQNSDIIQLLDAQDNHVHALAHIPNAPSGDYLSLPNPKVCRNGSMQNNSSLRIVPGLNLSSYNSGFGNIENDVSILFISKGKPNNSVNSQNENQIFWRSLRQPEWISPTLRVEIYKNQNYLEWNKITDPFPDDNLSGYLITRTLLDNISFLKGPEDGKIYLAGDKIDSSVVIAVINNSNILNFYDNFYHKCGTGYIYTIYAYRFVKDNLGEDNNPVFSRGRSYNELYYAQAQAIKSFLEKPLFSQKKLEICKGDSFNLIAVTNENYEEIIWFKNNEQIKNKVSKEIIIREEGNYFCKVINEYGCEAFSDTFQLTLKPFPNANLFVYGNLITKDTNIFKCPNDEIILSVNEEYEIEWFLNGYSIEKGKSTLLIKEDGEYFAKISNREACSMNTIKVKIISQRDSFYISPSFLYFNLYKNETFSDRTIGIKNRSKQPIEIVKFTCPFGFQLLNSLPLQIEAEKFINVTIRFQYDNYIDIKGYLSLYSSCGFKDSVYVAGTKKDTGLYSSVDTLDFGELSCKKLGIYTVFQIHNPTYDSAIIYQPKFEKPFAITDKFYPYTLKAKKSVDIAVNFVPGDFGDYSYQLLIPYKFLNVYDTLRVLLKGSKTLPNVEIQPDFIEFPTLFDCDSTIDTIITITNKSTYSIKTEQLNNLQNISIPELPISLLPGESQQIKINLNFNSDVDSIFALIFNINPCNIEKQINLKIRKQNQIIQLEKDTLDFGTVVYCGGQSLHKRTLKLRTINYDSTKKFVVKKVDVSGSFKSNLFSGKELINDNQIDVYFNPDVDGDFTGFIRIVIEPCNIIKNLYLRGRRATPLINISENVLDFGSVQSNAKAFRKIQIKNQGIIEIKIEKIENLKLPFELYKLSSILPAIIEPDSIFEIEFSYNPQNSNNDTNEITLLFTEPCPQSRQVLLKGDSFTGDTINFKIFIRNLKAKVGDNFEIPINLILPNNFQIQLFNLEGINFDLSYNPTLFLPIGVRFGDSFEKSEIKQILFKEELAGKSSIFIFLENFKNFKSGVLAYLNGKVLGGNAQKTSLKLENIYFYSNRLVEVQIEEGELEIEGKCNPEDRLVDLSNEPVLTILDMNYHKVKFILNVISDENAKLVIFDNLGRQVRILFDGEKKAGKYELELNLELLPNGIFYAVFSNGNILKTLAFPVIK